MTALKSIDHDLWVVETPLRFLGLQLGRRMSVIRLSSGELLIHSPAQLSDPLASELNDLGPARYVVPASSLHGHLFMEHYKARYPEALLFAAPELSRRRRDLQFDGELGDQPDLRWAADIDQALFPGPRLGAEVVFLHRASRSLLVGDVVWNVTADMAAAPRLWAGWRVGVRPTPLYRRTMQDRTGTRAALRRILGWEFDRIIVGHGQTVERGGREALRRAYAWLEPI